MRRRNFPQRAVGIPVAWAQSDDAPRVLAVWDERGAPQWEQMRQWRLYDILPAQSGQNSVKFWGMRRGFRCLCRAAYIWTILP